MRYADAPDALQTYLREISVYPTLSFEEEQDLAKRWANDKDEAALHKLMQCYLRLVVKVAVSFRGYGLPINEMIQEGNLGLMQAIMRFDHERGFRLSTYAMWWIRANIQEYILANWSLVKIGNSSNQKKLFFNLKRLKNELREFSVNGGELSSTVVSKIADELNVNEKDVVDMHQRIATGDHSLNAKVGSEDDDSNEWVDLLESEGASVEERIANADELSYRQEALTAALMLLDDRERAIIEARRLNEDPPTLEELSQEYGVSRERVRQLEQRAFQKLQKHLQAEAAE